MHSKEKSKSTDSTGRRTRLNRAEEKYCNLVEDLLFVEDVLITPVAFASILEQNFNFSQQQGKTSRLRMYPFFVPIFFNLSDSVVARTRKPILKSNI